MTSETEVTVGSSVHGADAVTVSSEESDGGLNQFVLVSIKPIAKCGSQKVVVCQSGVVGMSWSTFMTYFWVSPLISIKNFDSENYILSRSEPVLKTKTASLNGTALYTGSA